MLVLYIFWISLGVLLYVGVGYLALCAIVGFFCEKPLNKKEIYPTVTLLIPAFNEQDIIEQKLSNVLQLDYPTDKLHIAVVSESNDDTNAIVKRFRSDGITLYEFTERQGKSKMLYDVVPRLRDEIIVFSDANALYKKDALCKLVRSFNDPQIGAVVGRLIISNPNDSSMTQGESLYKKYEGLLRRNNSKVHSVLGADGSMLAIRRELYFPISAAQGDDFELAVRVLIKGYGVVFEPEAVSYEKASLSHVQEAKRKKRIVAGFFKTSFILLKELFIPVRCGLIIQLISNKILRWFSPYFLIILFISNALLCTVHVAYRVFFICQCLWYTVSILSILYTGVTQRVLPKPLSIAVYFISFNYAFGVGILMGLFTKQEAFWEKVR